MPDLDTDCEIKWVKIEIVGCKTLHICSYYHPHLHDEESLNKLIESFSKMGSIQNNLVIVGGDFNLLFNFNLSAMVHPGESHICNPCTPHFFPCRRKILLSSVMLCRLAENHINGWYTLFRFDGRCKFKMHSCCLGHVSDFMKTLFNDV